MNGSIKRRATASERNKSANFRVRTLASLYHSRESGNAFDQILGPLLSLPGEGGGAKAIFAMKDLHDSRVTVRSWKIP